MLEIHENIEQKCLEIKDNYRDQIELLQSRIYLLEGKDRLLMTMYLINGNSFRQIARLAGINEANIARRIHKLARRLIEGEYIMCLRNRNKFTNLEMDIARDYFLVGLSMRKIAQKQHCSFYHVRKTTKKIQQIITVIKGQRNNANIRRFKKISMARTNNRQSCTALQNVRPNYRQTKSIQFRTQMSA